MLHCVKGLITVSRASKRRNRVRTHTYMRRRRDQPNELPLDVDLVDSQELV